MGEIVLTAAIGLAISAVVLWLLLVVLLLVRRPERATLETAARLPRDVVALTRNLLKQGRLPRGAKVRLWLLLVYLASPVDLIPDFFPVIGYADDVIVTALLLRGVARSTGIDALRAAWSGDQRGFDALARVCGLYASR